MRSAARGPPRQLATIRPPWIATRAASSASSSRSLRAWTVSLKRIRSSARRVICCTAAVGQAPTRPMPRPDRDSGSSDASTSASASVAVRGCVLVSSAVPEGAGSAVARRTDPVRSCPANRSRRPASSASTWARSTVFRASSGTPKRAIARSTNSLASAGEPSKRPDLLPFRRDLLRFHRVLGEARAGFLLVLLGVAPPRLHDLRAVVEAQIESQLARARLGATSSTPSARRSPGPRSSGSGTVTPVALRIFLGLAEDDIEHGAVDRAVRREHHDRSDELGRLAEAVDPSLALLVPGRVPRQVVVDDGVEELLEVDAFGQAVGGDEDALDLLFLVAGAMSATRSRRSSGVSTPVTASTLSFGKALRRPSRTCSAVAR